LPLMTPPVVMVNPGGRPVAVKAAPLLAVTV
jgi:hypothetical protein